MSLGACFRATRKIGTIANPDGDHRSIRVSTSAIKIISRHDGLLASKNFINTALTSGSRAVLVIKPTVPYFSPQRNQNNPQQRDKVAEIDAAKGATPNNLADA